MIQLKHIMKEGDDIIKEKEWVDKGTEELTKVLTFLEENKIEYDLEPPEKFKKWRTIKNKTYLITNENDRL